MDDSGPSVELSVIVPVRDEVDNIAALVSELEAFRAAQPLSMEVVIVDDGSRDGSWQRLREASCGKPWLRGLRFRTGCGQTAAMAAGTHASRGRYLGFLDADLQNDPNDLPRLLEPILADEADVVCGWRRDRHDSVWRRTIPSVIANFVIRKSLHLRIHDVGCTLKVFRREYLEGVNILGEMHRFLPAYAQAQGARITEVVVNHRPRLRGTSKYGFSRIGKVLVDLLTVVMLSSYSSSPAYLFGKIAAFFFALGTVAFGVVAYRAFFLGHVESTPLIFIMLLLYITSLLCLMSGLLAELNVRILYQVGVTRPYDIRDTIGMDAADSADGN